MILNRRARACLEENVKIEVLETWVSVVQVVQSFHSDGVLHNLHNQRPVFEQWSFFITAAAKIARGDLAPASGAGRGHIRGA
jgi:hypothetical protein